MNPVDRTTAIPALPNQAGQANVPGLRQIFLIEARHVLGLIDPRTLPGSLLTWTLPTNGLQLAEDADVLRLRIIPGLGDYEQKALVSVQGISYQQAFQVLVPRDHPQTVLAVARMAGRKWLAVYDDGNGNRKVVGTPKQPLRFASGLKTAPNGYSLNFTGETRYPAYFLDDADLFSLDAEFSYGFSYDFYS